MKSVFPPASETGSASDSLKKNKTPQSSGTLSQTLHTFWSWAFLIVALGAISAGILVFREADQNVVIPSIVQAQTQPAVAVCPWNGPGVKPFGGSCSNPNGCSLEVYAQNDAQGWAHVRCYDGTGTPPQFCNEYTDPGCSGVLADNLTYIAAIVQGEEQGVVMRFNAQQNPYSSVLVMHKGSSGTVFADDRVDYPGDPKDVASLQNDYGMRVVGIVWADTGIAYGLWPSDAGRFTRKSALPSSGLEMAARTTKVFEWIDQELNDANKPFGLAGSSGGAQAILDPFLTNSYLVNKIKYLGLVSYAPFFNAYNNCTDYTPPGTYVRSSDGTLTNNPADSGATMRNGAGNDAPKALNDGIWALTTSDPGCKNKFNLTPPIPSVPTSTIAALTESSSAQVILQSLLDGGATAYQNTLHVTVATKNGSDTIQGVTWSAGGVYNHPYFAGAQKIWNECTTQSHGTPLTQPNLPCFDPIYDEIVNTLPVFSPIANAGTDQVKSDGDGNGMESVTLSASGSSDPDGTIVSYEWKEGVNILGASATTTLELAAGIHTLTLTVTDDDGYTDTDEVQVTVNPNQVPVANAGLDQNIGIGQTVNFSGAGSTDADGTIVSYAWDFGDTATSTGDNVSHPYLLAGNYTATLLVMDNAGATSTDTAIINVIANQPPVASAGPDQNVTDSDGNGSQPVTLNGGGSSDPDGSIVSYEWKEGAVVVGTGATPSASLAVGAHTITLTVTDNGGAQSSDTVLITVNPQPVPQTTLYFSLASSGTVGGVSVANEDIIAFTGSQFSIYFDGSDVGVGSLTLDAFSVLSSSEILMSFTDAAIIPGISGTVDDSDVVKFSSASLRESTSGSFSMYFDASDVGLSTNDEDIDAVELLADGRVLVSTTGSFSVTGLSGEDEDLIALTPTSLGGTTAGTWAMYFDGSDVSLTLNDEDVDAAAVTANGSIYLSTIGNFAVTGISGADEDIFVFNPNTLGATTAGSFSPALFFDGSVWGLGGNDIFAIDLP